MRMRWRSMIRRVLAHPVTWLYLSIGALLLILGPFIGGLDVEFHSQFQSDLSRLRTDPRSPLIVTLCDYAFGELIVDFYRGSIKRLELPNFVCVSMNERSQAFAQEHGIPGMLITRLVDNSEDTSWRSRGYFQKLVFRMTLMYNIALNGFDALYTDTDMTYFRDPRPFIPTTGYDIIAMNDSGVYNAGFMFIKGNSRTSRFLLESLIYSVRTKIHDQWVYDANIKRSTVLKSLLLDYTRFQNGKEYYIAHKRMFHEESACADCIVVHNNFIIGYFSKIYRNQELLLFDGGDPSYYENSLHYISFDAPKTLLLAEIETALSLFLELAITTNTVLVMPRFSCYLCLSRNPRDRDICDPEHGCTFQYNWDVEWMMSHPECRRLFRENSFPHNPKTSSPIRDAFRFAQSTPHPFVNDLHLMEIDVKESLLEKAWVHYRVNDVKELHKEQRDHHFCLRRANLE